MKKKRRRKPKLGVRKAGANSRGQEDARRAKQRAEKETKVATDVEELINPFDHMSMDQKKEAALSLCKRRLQVIILTFLLKMNCNILIAGVRCFWTEHIWEQGNDQCRGGCSGPKFDLNTIFLFYLLNLHGVPELIHLLVF